MLKACPILGDAELEACILRVQRACNEEGITSHNDILGEAGEYLFWEPGNLAYVDICKKLCQEERLMVR